jgi:flagellar biogenesis protein FliO
MDSFFHDLSIIFLFFALLALVAWFSVRIRRHIKTSNSDKGKVNLLHVLHVGTKERVMLIEYRSSDYLIGVTPNQVTLIDKVEHSNSMNISVGQQSGTDS